LPKSQGGELTVHPYANKTSAATAADFDLRHQFVSSVVWQLNYYHGESSWERGFLNGWAVSTIVNVHSGFPFRVESYKVCNSLQNSPGWSGTLHPRRTFRGWSPNVSVEGFSF
jgi:hypothetical protein